RRGAARSRLGKKSEDRNGFRRPSDGSRQEPEGGKGKPGSSSMPSCFLASGLRRSGVQGGVHTTFTVQLLTPGNCSTRDFTWALMLTCSGQPCAVRVISTVTFCLGSSGFSAGTGAKSTL